jgi:hypothetical protein
MQQAQIHEAQIAARSKMYFNSAREAFERGKLRALGVPDLPAYPGDGSTACLTNCRCVWNCEQDTIDNEPVWNCFWDIQGPDDANCQDCLDRHNDWYPLVVPAA